MLREMYNRANGDSQTVEIITYLNSNYRRIKNNKRIIDGFFCSKWSQSIINELYPNELLCVYLYFSLLFGWYR